MVFSNLIDDVVLKKHFKICLEYLERLGIVFLQNLYGALFGVLLTNLDEILYESFGKILI